LVWSILIPLTIQIWSWWIWWHCNIFDWLEFSSWEYKHLGFIFRLVGFIIHSFGDIVKRCEKAGHLPHEMWQLSVPNLYQSVEASRAQQLISTLILLSQRLTHAQKGRGQTQCTGPWSDLVFGESLCIICQLARRGCYFDKCWVSGCDSARRTQAPIAVSWHTWHALLPVVDDMKLRQVETKIQFKQAKLYRNNTFLPFGLSISKNDAQNLPTWSHIVYFRSTNAQTEEIMCQLLNSAAGWLPEHLTGNAAALLRKVSLI
jgi:hypothetical protein